MYFTNNGLRAQPMQGVKVVARWVDPTTGVPSHRYVASSVSGFLFRGNAGNPVTGFVRPNDLVMRNALIGETIPRPT